MIIGKSASAGKAGRCGWNDRRSGKSRHCSQGVLLSGAGSWHCELPAESKDTMHFCCITGWSAGFWNDSGLTVDVRTPWRTRFSARDCRGPSTTRADSRMRFRLTPLRMTFDWCAACGSIPTPWRISTKRKPSGRGAAAGLRVRRGNRGGRSSCRRTWPAAAGQC